MSGTLFDDDPDTTTSLANQRHEALERTWFAERPDRPTACRAAECGARLAWALTPAGEWMPLDYRPDPAGNVEVERLRQARVARVVSDVEIGMVAGIARGNGRPDVLRYTAHSASCPAAGRFRRRA